MRTVLTAALALAASGCATAPDATPFASTPAAVSLESDAPDSMRWLYGSGEAAGASIQTYRMLADYAVMVSRQRSIPQSVPMGIGGTV